MAATGIAFLIYGIFRIDNPNITVQGGMASPVQGAPKAGTTKLHFDGQQETIDVFFLSQAAFAVESQGDGYHVVDPKPGLLTLRDTEVGGNEARYAFLFKLGKLTPQGIQLSEISVGIGTDLSSFPNLLEFKVGIPLAEYAIYPAPGSTTRELLFITSTQNWSLRCLLDAGQHGEQGLWCQTPGILFWVPANPIGVVSIGGQQRSGVTLTISADDQRDGTYCGYADIQQFSDYGRINDHTHPVALRMYAVQTKIAPSGLTAEAVHWKLYDAGIEKVDTIEEIPSAYRDDPRNEPATYSIRALQSSIWMTVHQDDTWTSGFQFDGEIRPFWLFDRSNAGIRLFGKALRCDETGPNEISVSGTASPRRALVGDVIALYTTVPDAVEQDLAIFGVAYGDFTLVVGRLPQQMIEEEFVQFGSDSGWAFPICQIRKSPLKGDAPGADTQLVTGLDPRTEVYRPANGARSIQFVFDWHDQTCNRDFFDGFEILPQSVGTLQPENSTIMFGTTTSASYAPDVDASDFAYKSIEATLTLPPAPANVEERIRGSRDSKAAPAILWKEDFGGASRPDTDLRRVWDSGVDTSGKFRQDYVAFIKNNANARGGALSLTLPYGWTAQFDPGPSPDSRVVAAFHAIRQSNAKPALEEDMAVRSVRRFRMRTESGEVETPLPASFWFPNSANLDVVFPKDSMSRGSDVASPLDPNWSGFISSHGTVVPPVGVPATLGALIKNLKFDYVAWDGQGVTAVCDPDPTTLPQTGTLKLKNFTLVIHRNQIEQFSMSFEWFLPFFNFYPPILSSATWLTFNGRWEKNGNGEGIVIRAGGIGDEIVGLFGGTLDLQFSDIELAAVGTKTKVRLRGAIHLSENAEVSAWFDTPLPPIAFRGLEFDFDNPLADLGDIDVQLDTEVTVFPRGFRYQLNGLRLNIPSTNIRRITLIGGLRYATPSAAFLANPDFAVELPVDFSTSTLKIGPPKFLVKGVAVDIFGFFTIGFSDLTLTGSQISGQVSIAEAWGGGNGLTGTFYFGTANDNSRNKFWSIYLQSNGDFKIGPVSASNAGILLAHDATRAGLRDKLIGADLGELQSYLAHPDGWTFSDEFPWLAGLWFDNLKAGGLPPAFLSGGKGILVLSDSGLFRGRFPIRMMSIDLSTVDLGIDWRNRAIAASITLRDLNYGSYEMDAGTVSFLISPPQFMASWGFPFGGDWGRAVKLRWQPPTPIIPINAVDGGVMLSFGGTIETGVALRVGLHETIGSDGGMFGAFITGKIMLGGTVSMAVTTGHETELTHVGTISLDIEADGGLVIAGIRWNVLRVFVDVGVGFVLVIGHNYVRAQYGAHFSAGYEVCPTPCTCVHGSVGFSYGLSAQTTSPYAWDPNYTPPPGTLLAQLFDQERSGDAIVELLREDFR